MIQRRKRFLAGMLAAVTGLGMLSGMSAAAGEAETARGRYLESDVVLPEDLFARDIERMEDGSLAVIGQQTKSGPDCYAVYTSQDGGASWEEQYALSYGNETVFWADVKLSPTGGGAAIVLQENASGDAEPSTGSLDMEYVFLTFDASGAVQDRVLEEGDLRMVEYTQQGELVGLTYQNGAVLLNQETGECTSEISSAFANTLGICGEELLLLTDEEVQRYDLHTGEPLPRDEALNEALYAASESGYMQTSTIGFPILFAQDTQGRLYYCTDQGIYSHTMEGTVVEQVIDDSLVSLSSPNVTLQSMVVLDQTFYVLETEDGVSMKLLKYEYDSEVASVPERELTVYSLTENAQVRQAIVGFQKQYPDTYVNYRVGMNGTDGVTAADAIRTLNTEILAGNGPDVLVLDGMSADTYASQGILTDLSSIAEETAQSDGLLENITDTYRTEEGLMAIPTRFSLEVVAGLTEQYQITDGFASLEAFAAQPGVLEAFDIANLAELLYPVCAGSWENEDHTINQEKLSEFVNGVKSVGDVYRQSADTQTLERLSLLEGGAASYWSLVNAEKDGIGIGIMELLTGSAKLRFGGLGSVISYAGILSVRPEEGACRFAPLAMQQEHVFYPSDVLSILNTAKEQERAVQFVSYMLSGEAQDAGSRLELGFPVNRKSFDRLLSENQFEDGAYGLTFSDGDGNMADLTYEWPSQEEMDALREMAEAASVSADTEQIKRETVITEVKRCMCGEISADEAVNSIMQKLNLYLAE